MAKQKSLLESQRYCYLCVNDINHIDFKDTMLLRRFISSYMKIVPRKRSGVCSKHQRKLATSIKRARFMGMLPYVPK
jgi:small subunit ribosomal protein S18